MTEADIEKMKQIIAEKKEKENFFYGEKKIGVGKVQQRHQNIGLDSERTKKITQ
ncbi:MAG: hypothetical protein RSE05_09840 [Clostridium sp.]